VGEFGDKFRKARESKDLTFDDVSNVTKISARMLQAIEEEHFDVLPGGVFNKGFIRAYAKHLGLNDEEAVTDYLTCLRQAQIDAQQVWEPQRPAPTRVAPPNRRPAAEPGKPAVKAPVAVKPPVVAKPPVPVQSEELPDLQLPRAEDVRPPRKNFGQNPSVEIPWKLIGATAVVLFLGILLWTRHYRTPRTETASASAPVAAPISNAGVAPAAITPSAASANRPTATPANNPATLKPATAPASDLPQPTQASAATHSSSTAPTPAADTGETEINKSDVTIRSFGKTKAKPADKPVASLKLVIRATENSWISVLADGQLVTEETLIAPAHTSVHATREIVVKVGNAAGVSFLFNGAETPLQGNEAEVKTLVFDASGMKEAPAQPSPTAN
jgi:cytoskeletal protein RodZ